MAGNVLYFGYGANRDRKMIAAILGKPESELVGHPALLDGHELGVQTLAQIPDDIAHSAPSPTSPRALLKKAWGDDFSSYVIRQNPHAKVGGTVWELTQDEREKIRDWELIDFGWYEDCTAQAVTTDGQTVDVVTERIGSEQPVDHIVDGLDYPTWLNEPHTFIEIATCTRQP